MGLNLAVARLRFAVEDFGICVGGHIVNRARKNKATWALLRAIAGLNESER